MEESDIIRFLNGTSSAEEEQAILDWVSSCEENRALFVEINNLYISQYMPSEKATDEQYNKFKKITDIQRDISVKGKREPSNKYNRRFTRRWVSYAAAIALFIMLSLNLKYNWISKGSNPIVQVSQLPVEMVNTMYADKGVKGTVVLPDGSKVWLNSDSKIKYPVRFNGATREVEFSGEGYFEVVKDTAYPMIVRCNKNFRIEVLGTKFNIKSYDNDDMAQATLYSGKIRLVEEHNGISKVIDIKPNEAVIVKNDEKDTKMIKPQKPQVASSWKDGDLVFDSISLKEAAKMLERWHGVKVNILNKDKENMLVTASFKAESIVQIMDLLKFSLGLDYSIDGKVVTINR